MTSYYFDVSDIIEYFSYHMSASGIQRVQLEFVRHFAAGGHDDCLFVANNAGNIGFAVADPDLLLDLVRHIDQGDASRQQMSDLLTDIRQSTRIVTPQPGDVFFVSGAFWASSNTSRSCWIAKKLGARVGFLCYDLIPIRHPDFCDASLVSTFAAAIQPAFFLVDFVMTISEYVKRDVDAYLAELGNPLPVIALPLAHELNPIRGKSGIRGEVWGLLKKRYVLFVSTIEVRKNHSWLFSVWQRLVEEMPDEVPELVWVGRPGWLVSDLMNKVQRLDHLDGRLHIFSGLSDTELTALYEHCWFTVFPSLAEGWGLPVAESLIFGRPAVVSPVDSLPEVGGDFVWYVDPLNVTGGVQFIGDLIRNPGKVDAAAARIAREFCPRRWSDVANDLMAGLKSLDADTSPRNRTEQITFRPGMLYSIGEPIDADADLGFRQRLALEDRFDEGWFGAEHWGRWMKGRKGVLHLARGTDAPAGRYMLYLKIGCVPFWQGVQFSIHCPQSGEEVIAMATPGRQSDVLATFNFSAGDCDLVFRVDRADVAGAADPRPLSIGLTAFGFAPVSDSTAIARLTRKLDQGMPPVLHAVRVGAQSQLKDRSNNSRFAWVGRIATRARREGLAPTIFRVKRRIGIILGRPE